MRMLSSWLAVHVTVRTLPSLTADLACGMITTHRGTTVWLFSNGVCCVRDAWCQPRQDGDKGRPVRLKASDRHQRVRVSVHTPVPPYQSTCAVARRMPPWPCLGAPRSRTCPGAIHGAIHTDVPYKGVMYNTERNNPRKD